MELPDGVTLLPDRMNEKIKTRCQLIATLIQPTMREPNIELNALMTLLTSLTLTCYGIEYTPEHVMRMGVAMHCAQMKVIGEIRASQPKKPKPKKKEKNG